ncbi:MAG: enoyl-CoA hydratase/isomerase family protein [Candidatus Thermoplasmatota archaeon]|nr:enoyl-CoA hydratase/isomerase family protein [Candidatus Thermoplasmatota archaeon]MCL5730620.1 enoyl-CoA hydratase/isomerase family protein [Candidatus Thermoplasmatota archaeon]
MAIVETTIEGSTMIIRLNRPEKMNALNRDMLEGIASALNYASENNSLRAVIVSSTGDHFSAGADIAELHSLDTKGAKEFRATMRRIVDLILDMDIPVIFALKGYSLGGALEISEWADIRVAAKDSKLGQPEVAIGINAGAGGNSMLPFLVGRGMASFLSMTGEKIDAEEARRIGLVDLVVEGDPLEEAVKIASKISSFNYRTIRAIKRSMVESSVSGLKIGFTKEESFFIELAADREVKERMEKFLKR